MGVLDGRGQAAGAARVKDRDQDVLPDEPQRLEGQYALDILCRDNVMPVRVHSKLPESVCVWGPPQEGMGGSLGAFSRYISGTPPSPPREACRC